MEVLSAVIAIGGFLLGLCTAFAGIVTRASQAEKKTYAAQRDFEHLKNCYRQLAENQKLILDEIQERTHSLQSTLKEQSIYLNLVLTKLNAEDRSIGTIERQVREHKKSD